MRQWMQVAGLVIVAGWFACSSSESGGANGTGGADGCIAETDTDFCSRLGKDCGSVTDRNACGDVQTAASCGTCVSPRVCGGDNVCCIPETDAVFCARLGASCGIVSDTDNCGNDRTIADCTFGAGCPGSLPCVGQVCGCVPETDTAFCDRIAKDCDSVTATDNCGNDRTVADCSFGAGCSVEFVCDLNVCVPPN
jgi:hypothetical protein